MQRDLQRLIAQMTLEEKASLCSGAGFWQTKGIERLGIPSIWLTDGPHGLRKQRDSADHLGIYDSVPATCFPAAATVASSWDRDLIERMGRALGEECQAEGVAILLGPGANIKRSPLCGRNFEYFSEDPYLSSEMAAAHIRGVQQEGVGTSLKHFAANNQEHRRMTVNAVVDERTLREIYLASFEGAVKQAQPWTVMCAYNKVNGTYASEHPTLLTDILRNEWGHTGIVVSDWGAVNDRVAGLAAGLDLEMPFTDDTNDRQIVTAVRSGQLPEETLNRAVERLLTIVFRAVDQRRADASYDVDAHHRLAREVARESMVLLKNDDQMLPLNKAATIAVIGALARQPRYQGGGSSHVKPTRLDDIYAEIVRSAGSEARVSYAQGYDLDHDALDQELIAAARQAAQQATAAIVFAGLPERYESEGYDRTHLRIPDNQVAVIEAVAEAQPNLVVVLSNGAPVEMPWLGNVKAVLEAYLGGQALGGALADLLFGDANPCGKLAETFPHTLAHNPSYLNFPGEGDRVDYREGVFVGYRYYAAKQIEPLFPFGHGLSYTRFAYSDLTLSTSAIDDTETVTVSVTVTNIGERAGKEIVQLYVRDVAGSVIRPEQELKGFAKVALQPGAAQTVTFTLDQRAFAYYNVELRDWHVETGEFVVAIGQSSQAIVAQATLHVTSTRSLPRRYTRNSTLGDVLADPVGRAMFQPLLESGIPGFTDDDAEAMAMAMLQNAPLRILPWLAKGLTRETLDARLQQLNAAHG